MGEHDDIDLIEDQARMRLVAVMLVCFMALALVFGIGLFEAAPAIAEWLGALLVGA